MPNDTASASPLISSDLKKMLIVPALTLLIAVAVAWFAAQGSQSELRFKVESLEKKDSATEASIKANTDAINQMVITMARNADAMTRLAEDLKVLTEEQRRNWQMNRQK